jgi:hypothetical protein
MQTRSKIAGAVALGLLLAGFAPAQGIEVRSGGVVMHGSTSNTTRPATIKLRQVEKETPEYETIKTDGVRKGSARYELLIAKMHKRIKKACKAAAEAANHDCVLRAGDVKDDRGLHVADLTDDVIEQLESVDSPA